MRLLSGNPVGYLARNPAQRRGSHLSCDILINRLSPDDKRAADRPIVLILVYDLLQPLLVEFQEIIQIYRFDKIDVREKLCPGGLIWRSLSDEPVSQLDCIIFDFFLGRLSSGQSSALDPSTVYFHLIDNLFELTSRPISLLAQRG